MVGLLHIVPAQAAVAPSQSVHFAMSPRLIAKLSVIKQWKSSKEFSCLNILWNRESHWNPKAFNKSSGAFGIAQFLPQTWGNYKYPYMPKDPRVQIKAGLRYITVRYGSPCKALSFWNKQARLGNPWY
jgi:membrane-bound lytic murein transglycosylase MltF